MGENIEVKDVQKTEYLDKNGLDMLWTKVKENTHNLVEVEYNRAKAKEDSLSQEIASVKPAEGKVFLLAEVREDGKILKDDTLLFGEPNTGVFSYIDAHGICIDNTASDIGHRNITIVSTGIMSDDDNRSDTGVWNTSGGITDLTSYAKKTDIPAVDTSDFVSKSDTITQTINSGLIAMDKLLVFSKGYYDLSASLRGGIFIEGADAKFTLNDTTASHNHMVLTASKLTMSQDVGDNTLLITTSGIANTDNNADHVYATDGSIADLTLYAKKSESVDNTALTVLELKITANTTAINGKLDTGNYIRYDGTNTSTYNIDRGIEINDSLYHARYGKDGLNIHYPDNSRFTANPSIVNGYKENKEFRIDNNGISCSNEYGHLTINSNSIDSSTNTDHNFYIDRNTIRIGDETGDFSFKIDRDGITFPNGSDSKIPTSNGSYIYIDNYALKSELPTVPTKVSQLLNDSEFITKSVYDEKIAALEARIAALEAKHAETA